MAISLNTQNNLDIDETNGVQLNVTDENGAAAALQANATFNYLLGNTYRSQAATGGDATAFPQVAHEANFISLNVGVGSTISDLIFTHPLGTTPETYGVFSTSVGFPTTLKAIDGTTINLFLDSSNNNVLLGRAGTSASSPLVFAIVLDENPTTHASAGAYIVQYGVMQHNLLGTVPNDIVDLTNFIFVGAASTTTTTSTFSDFGDVPSGNTGFATIAPDSAAPGTSGDVQLLVTGQVLQTKGQNTTLVDTTVNVSTQGLGSGSQAVGENATLQIDFITGGTQDTGSFSEIAYTGHKEGITETSFVLTQVNPNGTTVNLTVAGWNDTSDTNPNGAKPGAATNVTLTGVQVFDANGNLAAGVTTSINANGDAVITGLELGDKIVVTSAGMDRITISNNGPNKNSSFDVGVIKFAATTTSVGQDNFQVGSFVNMADDGPNIDANTTIPTLQVDDTTFLTDDTEALSGFFTNVSGGSDTATTAYKLIATESTATGLIATGTNTAITLVQINDTLVRGVDGSSNVIFEVSISGSNLVLDQTLAIKHPTTDPNEAISASLANLLQLQGTITDRDNDPDSASVAIFDKLVFLDDGPKIDQNIAGGTIAFAENTTLTKTFAANSTATGNDLGDGVKIEQFTDLGGTSITETLSTDGKTLTYSEGTNDLFKLEVSNTGYTFTVLDTQQNSTNTLDFGAISAGGPKEIIDVPTVEDPNTIVRFDGLIITQDSDPRLLANNPGAGSTSDDANPDALGFGVKGGQASQVNNNEGFSAELLNGGEFADFTFEIQGIGGVKSVNVTYWTVSDNPTAGGPPILSAPVTETVSLTGGNSTVLFDKINIPNEGADKIFVEFEFLDKNGNPDTNAGVRVLNFKETQSSTFDPQTVAFTLSNTDNDLDKVISNSFSITVDPTLVV